MNKSKDYRRAYNSWHVTTEGDVEGRTTRDLGVFTGFIDDIAFHLADQCYYSLRFEPQETVREFIPKNSKVNVSFGIDSKTWDMNPHQRESYFSNLLKDRPVRVEAGQSYASVLLVSTAEEEIMKRNALAKLTDEEKKLLGLAK